ncbi:methionine biosynthesis protein MetW [Candidatus Desulforudis audaxviator]|uniref:Methyltransferase type 11 n=1 Tax=Desulforudis audaxviator (strain MP104C) TaxID=477974 RepID=B1I6U5_DESAP|nr:methionine biosynthesis protein MetW [Candidatus Desulforudis audaxviator]ACA60190.1 Methyltransferase type 11 [Candidatus Desulforudis audaxviator MP104C]
MIDRQLNYGRHLIKQFLKKASPYETVLDIGAGGGTDLKLAKDVNPKAETFAIESYLPYVENLRSQGITVYELDIERDRLPFDDGTVDVVIVNQVLEHIKEIFWVFHEITRVVPVSGKVIVGVPNLASLHNRVLLAMGRQPSTIRTNSAHVRGFTRGDVLKFLDDCFPHGYTLKGFGGSNFYPFPPVMARVLARIFPTMAWGIFFLLEKQREYDDGFLSFPVRERLETNFWLGEGR